MQEVQLIKDLSLLLRRVKKENIVYIEPTNTVYEMMSALDLFGDRHYLYRASKYIL